MSGEPEELGMDWDEVPGSRRPTHGSHCELDLAYAMNEIHDLALENAYLQHRADEWETHDCLEDHYCEDDHSDCVSAEDHDAEILAVNERLARHIGLFGRLRGARDDLYWTLRREGTGADDYSTPAVIELLDEILGEPNV